ncbi:hypothetical protein D9Q98_008322 [Chlorella vulgaris]|uniref:Uncharacterized protein n=1 Tax=Chlorella vulgaris TaxID=3077 RepID=A0A9D4TGF0_CHLVU|nr:hypothetical protein D9Q98_008322 [Chlorella vulgaris]
METVRVAIETKDRVAAHSREHDAFAHHVRAAPAYEAVAELTDVHKEFVSNRPSREHLQAALDAKDRLAAHGLRLPEEEAAWREELEEGMERLGASG